MKPKKDKIQSFSEWLEINHNHNNGWKLDKNGNVNDQDEFDELYEEYTISEQEKNDEKLL
ncbi:MAG: hypothetical protein HN601_13110 [Candidatus Marinimicrobia bacterium]|jgi:hypothetical protein|nr:hypothetical protein [Candidatus Neomarinimicrobiota bacterium]